MKQSGIDWIGEIPDDWKIEKFGHVLKERNEKNNPIISTERLSVSIDIGVTLYSDKTTNLDRFKDDFSQYKIAHEGDLVMNSMNVIVGSEGISPYFGCVSPAYYTYYCDDEDFNSARYCDYLFKTKSLKKFLRAIGKGIYAIDRGDDKVNTCRLKVSRMDMKNLLIPLPPKASQQRIAEYLDSKCAQIDSIIEESKKSIEEYKAWKQSVIFEAVTGKNLNCKKKDSGVEWIGEIPDGWEMKRLKNLFDFGKGLSITKENLKETGVSVISYGQIHSKQNSGTRIDDSLKRFVDESYLISNSNSLVRKSDFIFADTSEDLEGCGNCVYVDEEQTLFAGYHTIIFSSKIKQSNKYLAYLFKTDAWRNQIRSRCNGVKLFSITKRILSNVNLILPPLLEQESIAKMLDSKCAQIDSLIAEKESLIADLMEYKKSLIFEVVTGKRRI